MREREREGRERENLSKFSFQQRSLLLQVKRKIIASMCAASQPNVCHNLCSRHVAYNLQVITDRPF